MNKSTRIIISPKLRKSFLSTPVGLAMLIGGLLLVPILIFVFFTLPLMEKNDRNVRPEEIRYVRMIGPKPRVQLDGTVVVVDNLLRQTLNDYKSSEYVGWSPVAYDARHGGTWHVTLRIRAKNALGAYLLRDVDFFIKNDKVVKVRGLGGDNDK